VLGLTEVEILGEILGLMLGDNDGLID